MWRRREINRTAALQCADLFFLTTSSFLGGPEDSLQRSANQETSAASASLPESGAGKLQVFISGNQNTRNRLEWVAVRHLDDLRNYEQLC